jgi:iron(III) transport system permease protein
LSLRRTGRPLGTPTPVPAGVGVRRRAAISWLRRSTLSTRLDEARLLGVALIAVLGYLVAWPTLLLFLTTVRVQFVDASTLGQRAGSFTTHYLYAAFASTLGKIYLWQPLEHTLVTAFGACVVAIALGGGLAWCVSRFEFPLKRWLAPAVLLPYVVPSWAVSEAWLTTFHNVQFGGSPGILQGLGINPPTWLGAGAVPIILVVGIHSSSIVYLLASGSLRNIGAELEEAATVLGGSRARVLSRITVPLLIPAIAAGGALVFAGVVGDFGTAYLLGTPVHYETLATSLYSNLTTDQMGEVAVLASLVVLLGAGVILIESKISSRTERFKMLGTSEPIRPVRPRRRLASFGATGFLVAVVGVGAGAPLFILASTSVMSISGRLALSNFTLRYWLASHLTGHRLFPQGLLRGTELYSAIWTTIRIMGLAAILSGIVGLLVGYVVTRSRSRPIANSVRQLTFLPYLVPGISLAAAYIVLFERQQGPIPPLYGSLTLVVLAMIVLHLPLTSRSAIASFAQMGRSSEEAARIQGASFVRTMRRIVAPQQVRAFATAVTLAFISGVKELNVVIMLTISSAGLLMNLFFQLQGSFYQQQTDGICLVITLLALGGYLVVAKVARVDLISSLGGASATNRAA